MARSGCRPLPSAPRRTWGSASIAQLRTAFEQGQPLHMVPVAWTSIWIAALCLLATWSAVTWLAARSVGLDTAAAAHADHRVRAGADPRRPRRAGRLGAGDRPATNSR